MNRQSIYALSIKQPWAALLVYGIKQIEIRTWKTRRLGQVLIHAGKLLDPRPEAWQWITTPRLHEAAQLRGGIVGTAELIDCIEYSTINAFHADYQRHLNAPEWFRPPRMYGFVFQDARPLPFYPCSGTTVFFRVPSFKLE